MKLGTKVNITTNSFMGSIKGYVGTIINIYQSAEYPYDVIIEEFGLKDCVYPLKEGEFELMAEEN